MNYVYTVLLYILECIICKNKNIPGGDPDLMYKALRLNDLTKKRVVTLVLVTLVTLVLVTDLKKLKLK